jgi:hypothetical protein
MKMKKMKNKMEMRKELLGYLEDLEKLTIKRTFPREDFMYPQTRLEVIISTSVIKTIVNVEDLMSAILDKKYFTPLSIMRMIFEETILNTFTLSKLSKAKKIEEVNHILLRISVGKKTKLKSHDEMNPYNIITTLEEAEKYISLQDTNLKGIFNESYTFISDQVHPNAPSRYYFMKRYADKVRITYNPPTKDDIKMLLNHSCMAVGLFLFIIKRLIKMDLRNFQSK